MHSCEQCGRSFINLQGLSQHRRWHDVATCDLCARTIPREALEEHIASLHGVPVDLEDDSQAAGAESEDVVEDLQLHCPRCAYTCWSPENLEQHVHTHDTVVCVWCHIETERRLLPEHLGNCELRPSRPMPFISSGALLTNSASGYMYLTSNSANYPQGGTHLYPCAWCDLQFTKQALRQHMMGSHPDITRPPSEPPPTVEGYYRQVEVE